MSNLITLFLHKLFLKCILLTIFVVLNVNKGFSNVMIHENIKCITIVFQNIFIKVFFYYCRRDILND